MVIWKKRGKLPAATDLITANCQSTPIKLHNLAHYTSLEDAVWNLHARYATKDDLKALVWLMFFTIIIWSYVIDVYQWQKFSQNYISISVNSSIRVKMIAFPFQYNYLALLWLDGYIHIFREQTCQFLSYFAQVTSWFQHSVKFKKKAQLFMICFLYWLQKLHFVLEYMYEATLIWF